MGLAEQQLFEPGEYLNQHGPGFFTVCGKPDGIWRQNSYELRLLPQVIEAVDPSLDTWITQATFQTRTRRATNMQSVGLLFSDLDTYNRVGLRNKSPEEQAILLAGFCRVEGIPSPSVVLFSGRGIQAKWLLSDAMGSVDLPDWNQVQIALVKLLEPFAADTNARDISRVLRLDRTINTKSGEKCRIVYTSSGVESVIARYNFAEMLELLVDERYQEPKIESKRSPITSVQHRFGLTRLNWTRLHDIRSLWKLRGGVSEGFREVTLFWEVNFLLLAAPVRTQDIWKEAQVLASEIDNHGGWYMKSDLSTVFRKAKEMLDGATVSYRGVEYPPLYTPKNGTLIELFRITPDEEQNLETIISRNEKNRRRRESRYAGGAVPRELYERESIERTKPWIAEGISRGWWYERRQRAGETPGPHKLKTTPVYSALQDQPS